jgi:ligand-binding SRPBCC domain-containing protein
MRTTQYVRETTEDEKRANARAKVRNAAERGEKPSTVFVPDDLAWAFHRHEDELAALEQRAEQARAAAREHLLTQRRHQELQRTIDVVLAEMDEVARRERLALATVEARRRLGWEPDGE